MSNNGRKRSKGRLKKVLTGVLYFITAVFLIAFFSSVEMHEQENTITYDRFVEHLTMQNVVRINATEESNQIQVILQDGRLVKTLVPDFGSFTDLVMEEIEKGDNIQFSITKKSIFDSISISSVLPTIILIIFMMYFFTKRVDGGDYDIQPVKSETTFKDVAGIEEEKQQLWEIVQFLKKPKEYVSMGAKIPKGILLSGEP